VNSRHKDRAHAGAAIPPIAPASAGKPRVIPVILSLLWGTVLLGGLSLSYGAHLTAAILASIAVSSSPGFVEVDPTTNRIYASLVGSANAVVVIDGNSNSVITAIPLGSSAGFLGIYDVTNRVYVGTGGNTVSVIDGGSNSAVTTIPVGNGPTGLAVDRNTNTVYVANIQDNTLSVLDGVTNTV
jgi:YVTN family beta-propeller protein